MRNFSSLMSQNSGFWAPTFMKNMFALWKIGISVKFHWKFLKNQKRGITQKLSRILSNRNKKFYKNELKIYFQIFPRKWFFFNFLNIFSRSLYGSTTFIIRLKLHIMKDINKGNNYQQPEFRNSDYKLVEISRELWISLKIAPPKLLKVFQITQ